VAVVAVLGQVFLPALKAMVRMAVLEAALAIYKIPVTYLGLLD
jgi:hypothetical protein